jgi:hypothetical protein
MKAIVSRRILSGGLMAMAAMVVLGGCAVAPTSPTVMVLPGTQKSPGQFQADASACQLEAQNFVAPLAQAANNQAASNVVIGTMVGAAAGALLGQGSYNPGAVAAWGRGYRHAGGQCCSGREFASLFVQPATAIQFRLHAVHVSARPSGAWSTGVPQPTGRGCTAPTAAELSAASGSCSGLPAVVLLGADVSAAEYSAACRCAAPLWRAGGAELTQTHDPVGALQAHQAWSSRLSG